ncbi:MAG: inositol-3-phosphate synthase, partial [Candidatus Bathyarchaeota archaeon]|nr:inositol-3-phosphate synthase [Candidatus Bathyarchaeota archaeon]
MQKIKVALVGVGNCASAFVQGLRYYSNCEKGEECIGLHNLFLGGFHPRDIQIVAAFDIDNRKVGKDLAEAIFAPPNNTLKLVNVPQTNVTVHKGPVLDGIGEYTKNIVQISSLPEVNVADMLKESEAEIVVNL